MNTDSTFAAGVCWGPVINLVRDPRWGRASESTGEDPVVNGRFGVAFARGLMAAGESRYLKIVATAKHSSVYSLEDWCVGGPVKPGAAAEQTAAQKAAQVGSSDDPPGSGCFNRGTFDAVVPTRDLVEYYWPVWKMVVEGAAIPGIMCSHNAVNGVTSCDNGPFNNGVH